MNEPIENSGVTDAEATASTQQPSPAVSPASEPAQHAHAAEHAGAEQGTSSDETAEQGDVGEQDDDSADDGADEQASADGTPGAAQDPTKKKRRRKRKRKGAGGAPADGAAATAGPEGEHHGRPRREPFVPFARFFEAVHHGDRRHAFAAGELVAGRVERVTDDVIIVDLFGKATAVLSRYDVIEPEEIPEEARAVEAAQAAEAAHAGTPADDEGAAATAVATGDVVVVPAVTVTEAGASPVETVSAQEAAEAASDVVEDAEEEDTDEAEGEEGARARDAAAALEPFEPEPPAERIEAPPIGAVVRARVGSVSESGHIALTNRYIPRAETKAKLVFAREHRQRVRGTVFGFNRGGFDVLVRGMRVFCPANGMSLEPIDDPRTLVGERLEFTLPPRKGKAKGFVISRRTLLERESIKRRKAILRDIVEGQELTGRVTQVREFGAFVDIGEGLEGLVHQSEISWKHGVRPADVLRPGAEVKVKVLGIRRDGKKLRTTRIGLSIKALEADPWDAHVAGLHEGQAIKGKVVSATEFGAFLRIAEGVDGLLHISELGRELQHASQAVNEGQEIDVVIDRIDRKQRRISLSKLSPSEARVMEEGKLAGDAPDSLKPGSHIKVIVTKVDHSGIQVQVRGVLGKRGRAFLPMRELSTVGAADGMQKQTFAVGTELDVKVLPSERRGSLRVSVKGFEVDNERQAVREYKKEVSKQGFGTFGDLLKAKLASSGPSDGGGS
jgi:small subunit ribosomal protein S1